MDARPTPEQRELQSAATRLASNLGPSTVGDLDDATRRGRLEQSMAQAGWRDLRSGSRSEPLASGVEAVLVARELARRVCDVAFIGPLLAHDLLRRGGVDSVEATHTIAVSSDLAGLARAAGTALDGVAFDASGSSLAVALAADGQSLVEVPYQHVNSEGVDLTRPVVSLGNSASATPISGPLSHDDLLSWAALAVTLTAADLVGVMEGALALATDYARERRQYGAAIGSFQAVQHLLAEAKTMAEGALSAVMYAAWAVDALEPDEARAAAAVAKAYAARHAVTVCETAIQVHGGIGNTWECMAHVYLRRAILSSESFGGCQPQLTYLAHTRWGAFDGLS